MTWQKLSDYLRAMVIDAVQEAQSGHIGGALSAMDVATVLFADYLRYDPDEPQWRWRDRFILSAGHLSMLLYALHYAIGYLKREDLHNFRQLHSRTPGHPEQHFPAVECTTGPLGQGAAMAVGFAVAALHQRAKFGAELCDQQIVALLGDGCMQEGVTLAAASYAGHLALANLTWLYDKNNRQISGAIERVTSDDYPRIFAGFGWQVVSIDGHNYEQIDAALRLIRQPRRQPLLVICNTVLSKGTHTVEGDHRYHGAPLPAREAQLSRKMLGVEGETKFYWPVAARDFWRSKMCVQRAWVRRKNACWREKLADKNFAAAWQQHYRDEVDFRAVPYLAWSQKKQATRKAFGIILRHYAAYLPTLMGGSADLEPSNMTAEFNTYGGEFSAAQRAGRGLAFGVREFPMAAIVNGMALFGGTLPFAATFLCFSDYMRPALRLAAMQRLRVIYEFTHDSFLVGEDGPTHQPVEHLASLRAIPGLRVVRPADAEETEVLFRQAVNSSLPTVFCLTRQDVPLLSRTAAQRADIARGAYVLAGEEAHDLLFIATGSEVVLALRVAARLRAQGLRARVVSMPCREIFAQQERAYRARVLPATQRKRVVIEAGIAQGWEGYRGDAGLCISIEQFGKSAPGEDLAAYFGFTVDAVVTRVLQFFFRENKPHGAV